MRKIQQQNAYMKLKYYFLSFCWVLKPFSLSVLVNLCLKFLYIFSLSTLIRPLCFKLFQHLNFQPISPTSTLKYLHTHSFCEFVQKSKHVHMNIFEIRLIPSVVNWRNPLVSREQFISQITFREWNTEEFLSYNKKWIAVGNFYRFFCYWL